MTEERTNQDAWREVGRQFQSLGESLAEAFRAAWEDEENRQQMHDLRAGLEKMARDIGQAVREASESPEGQKVREEARKAAQSAREAGRNAWQDARPHMVSALRQVDAELQRIITKLEME
jgi:hypothetical protein